MTRHNWNKFKIQSHKFCNKAITQVYKLICANFASICLIKSTKYIFIQKFSSGATISEIWFGCITLSRRRMQPLANLAYRNKNDSWQQVKVSGQLNAHTNLLTVLYFLKCLPKQVSFDTSPKQPVIYVFIKRHLPSNALLLKALCVCDSKIRSGTFEAIYKALNQVVRALILKLEQLRANFYGTYLRNYECLLQSAVKQSEAILWTVCRAFRWCHFPCI